MFIYLIITLFLSVILNKISIVNIILISILFIIVVWLWIVIDNVNDIKARIYILSPFLSSDEQKEIYKQLYLIKEKEDYLELEEFLDKKIDSYIKNN